MKLTTISFGCVLICIAVAVADVPEPRFEPRFEPQTIDDSVEIGYGVAVGDVNGNGRIDILLADKSEIVWYANPGEPSGEWQRHVMAADLTERDNVCIAARDITGDGQVEVAVGAQWNPGETTDPEQSGAVFHLHRPDAPTERWEPIQITPHDPTTHRMRWVRADEGEFRLAILPLHGVGNRDGEGDPVRLQLVTPPEDLAGGEWRSEFVGTGLNMTHNLEPVSHDALPSDMVKVVGRQGIAQVGVGALATLFDRQPAFVTPPPPFLQHPGGEARAAMNGGWAVIATIEPMHGSSVVAYSGTEDADEPTRKVLDDTLNEGHALAAADFLGIGRPQVAAGWRRPNDEGKVGVRLYIPLDESGESWRTHTIDDDNMAAEDMAVADLDGNGRLDIIVAGRATNNLVIYWNRE